MKGNVNINTDKGWGGDRLRLGWSLDAVILPIKFSKIKCLKKGKQCEREHRLRLGWWLDAVILPIKFSKRKC